MATIKDIAKCAGVSHATVSNVLNHKGNVSAQKIKLVTDAVQKMGYRTNEAASTLRSGSTMTIAVILPGMDNIAYSDLYKSICSAAAQRGYGTLLKITNNVPGEESRSIADVLSARASFCIAVSSFSAPRKHYEPLTNAGIHVIFALRGRQEGYPYAGFDMVRAGREIGERLILEKKLKIGLMTNMARYTAEADLRAGLLTAINSAGGQMRYVESVASQYAKNAFALLMGDMPEAVVTTEEEMAQAVLSAGAFLGKRVEVITLAARRVIPPAEYTGYALHHRALGEKLVRLLLNGETNAPTLAQGFEPKAALPHTRAHATINMLSADTPAIRALRLLLPRLERDTGISLSVTLLPTAQVSRAFREEEVMRAYDVVRMDLSLMDHLAQRLLLPLDQLDIDVPALFRGFLPGMAEEYSIVEGRSLAIPFDPGCHLMFFRKDLLEDARIKRAYLEKYRTALRLPTTRAEYARLAAFLDQMGAAEGGRWRGVILTHRSSECVSDLASLGADNRWSSLTVDELEGYVQRQHLLESSATWARDGSWNSVVTRFAQGEGAMLIAHSNYACGMADDPLSTVSGQVGYAPAPGQKAFLGGGVIGAVKSSARHQEAALFFQWLYSSEISNAMALLCGCSPWAQAYEREDILDLYPWLTTVRAGLNNGVRRGLFGARTSDQMRLEQEIARLCAEATEGSLSCAEAALAINGLTE